MAGWYRSGLVRAWVPQLPSSPLSGLVSRTCWACFLKPAEAAGQKLAVFLLVEPAVRTGSRACPPLLVGSTAQRYLACHLPQAGSTSQRGSGPVGSGLALAAVGRKGCLVIAID